MSTKILILAASAAVGLLALTGVQSSAQAFEYRQYHRVDGRGHDHNRFPIHFFSHYRGQHEHDHC